MHLLWAKQLNANDIYKEMFSIYGGKCLLRKAVQNWVKKFSEEHLKATDDALPGHTVESAIQSTVQWVEEWIKADRKIMIGSVATALGCSHGLPYSIMHDCLKFRKVCRWWVPRGLKDPCNISYDIQMKEKICVTGLLLGMNHGCITTNLNQSMLQCSGKIPVHLLVQPGS
jgi:hypothetical protein